MKLQDVNPLTALFVVGVVGAGLYVWKKGSVSAAAAGAGAAVVNAAGAAASGAVGAVSSSVGLPTPDQTTTDAAVARWIIDHPSGGYLAASKWAGVPALMAALSMPAGSGYAPPPGPMLDAFPLPRTGDFARLDRATTYGAVLDVPSERYSDPTAYGLPL